MEDGGKKREGRGQVRDLRRSLDEIHELRHLNVAIAQVEQVIGSSLVACRVEGHRVRMHATRPLHLPFALHCLPGRGPPCPHARACRAGRGSD